MAPTPPAAGGSMPVGTARFVHSSLMLAIAALAAAHLLGALTIAPDPNAGLVLGFFALVLVVVGAVASKAMQARGVAWVRAHPDEARASIQAGRLPVAYFASSFIPAAINEGASFVALIALLLGGPLHLWVVVGFALLQIWLTTPSLAKLEQALT